MSHDGIVCIGTAPSISFVRQPELSLHRLDHTQHAEVQKALSCAQLPTLDGSWRINCPRLAFYFSFFRRS